MVPVRIAALGVAGVILCASISSCHGSGLSAAASLMREIPGCSGLSTWGGSSLDENTIDEGKCTLDDGTMLDTYVWAADDTSDLEQYVYWNGNSDSGCCIVGTTPTPWTVSLDTMAFASSYVTSLMSSVESALNGTLVTNPPPSWQYGAGNMPTGQPAPSPSPSPSPSPTSAKRQNVNVHHHKNPPVTVVTPTSPAATTQSSAWCTANAVYNTQYNDYDVYVHSNQPDQTVTATATDSDNDGESRQSYHTDSSGYADVYLYTGSGDTITVQLGAATCSTRA
jgi:hypothetical protein